jgi:hypothetical protein
MAPAFATARNGSRQEAVSVSLGEYSGRGTRFGSDELITLALYGRAQE